MEKLTYTEKEACKLLGIGRNVIIRARQQGKIAHVRVGGRVLYTKKHLDNFLADSEVSTDKRLIKKAS